MIRSALIWTSFLGVAACTAPDLGPEAFALPPGAPPPVVTDSLAYTLVHVPGAYRATALATYVNHTGHPVYFARCRANSVGPLTSVRRTGLDSTNAAIVGGVWACVGGVPTGLIARNGSVTTTVDLGSSDSPNAQPPVPLAERTGTFRIELALCARYASDSDHCTPLPQAARESATIALLAPPN
jgi:hypothetical protein